MMYNPFSFLIKMQLSSPVGLLKLKDLEDLINSFMFEICKQCHHTAVAIVRQDNKQIEK